MYELSLFSGAGGGLLGTKLLGWESLGYVEYNDYCQRIIAARIRDGVLKDAPIFGDIKAFISEGYADSYRGMVDVVSAGFPCQPFSVAGQRKGADDERNMWPQTIDVIRRVRPQIALLENVPGLLAHEYARRIFGDLAESGYDCKWRRLSAAETGAPHKRDRWWCIAYADIESNWAQQVARKECEDSTITRNNGSKESLAHTRSEESRRLSGFRRKEMATSRGRGKNLADTSRIKQRRKDERSERERVGSGGESNVANTHRPGLERQQLQVGTGEKFTTVGSSRWWISEPDVGRVANGVASRVDRLRALGNGQVPAVVATAWCLLNDH